ncbi:MAG: hypothetical protein N2691_02500 [Patescibacteria group bacterium]|nr:hypothetical protein [Patescibacteria group bacterium]
MSRKKGAPKAGTHFTRSQVLTVVAFAFILVCSLIMLGIDLSRSLFFRNVDRINLVFYDSRPVFYSLGATEAGNYAITFYPDLKTNVPGGYGYYRIGALGRLAELEKDPEIYLRAFSAITSTFTDYYFYQKGVGVFYGGPQEVSSISKPKTIQLFTLEGNASFFDRVYLALLFNRIQPSTIHDIKNLPFERLKDDTILQKDNFLKRYIGLFYNKTYRRENSNVQILYTDKSSYITAETLSNILNGNGIVVGDISRTEMNAGRCKVVEPEGTRTITGEKLATFFDCEHTSGDTDIYDILLIMGDLEDRWSIRQ